MSNQDGLKQDLKTRLLNSGWTIIIGIAIFGPFALPLLWRNPKYSRATKVFWSVATALITVFCLWAMKYSALLISQGMAAEPCRIEHYRPAFPPGQRAVKIFASKDQKKPVEKFSETKPFFEYLKQADGKVCDVNWTDAKNVIEEWFNSWQSAESSVGPEIDALIAKQAHPDAQVVPVQVQAQAQAQAQAQNGASRDKQLLQIRDRLSALKSKTYDSQKVRAAEIESILRSIEPGPLK